MPGRHTKKKKANGLTAKQRKLPKKLQQKIQLKLDRFRLNTNLLLNISPTKSTPTSFFISENKMLTPLFLSF